MAILRHAHALVGEARQSGTLPQPYSDALLGSIRELARSHQTTLSQIDSPRLGPTRVDQAMMLKLGTAVRQLTGRPDITETSHIRLDALLRSSIGETVLVANLTNQTSAKPVAGTITAYRFDPQRIGPQRWPTYAWMTLEHTRRHGVDHSGVTRLIGPGPGAVPG